MTLNVTVKVYEGRCRRPANLPRADYALIVARMSTDNFPADRSKGALKRFKVSH